MLRALDGELVAGIVALVSDFVGTARRAKFQAGLTFTAVVAPQLVQHGRHSLIRIGKHRSETLVDLRKRPALVQRLNDERPVIGAFCGGSLLLNVEVLRYGYRSENAEQHQNHHYLNKREPTGATKPRSAAVPYLQKY